MSCTVTTSAASRTGGTARLGAWTTSASMRHVRPAEPVPALVAQAAVRCAEVDPVDAPSARPGAGRRPRRRPTSTPTAGQDAQQGVGVAADAAGHGLQQLAAVEGDLHAAVLRQLAVARRERAGGLRPRERAEPVAAARDELGAGGVVGEHAVAAPRRGRDRRWAPRATPRRRRLRGSSRRAPRPPGRRRVMASSSGKPKPS